MGSGHQEIRGQRANDGGQKTVRITNNECRITKFEEKEGWPGNRVFGSGFRTSGNQEKTDKRST